MKDKKTDEGIKTSNFKDQDNFYSEDDYESEKIDNAKDANNITILKMFGILFALLAIIIIGSFLISPPSSRTVSEIIDNSDVLEEENGSEVMSVEYSSGQYVEYTEGPNDVAERFDSLNDVIKFEKDREVTQDFHKSLNEIEFMSPMICNLCKNCIEQYAIQEGYSCKKFELVNDTYEVVPGTEDSYYTFSNGDKYIEVHFVESLDGELHGYLKEL